MADNTIQQFHHLLEDLQDSIKGFNLATNQILLKLSNLHSKSIALNDICRKLNAEVDYEILQEHEKQK